MQKLILPINNCMLTASWKTVAYKNKYNLEHYGADLISSTGAVDGIRKIFASGDGVVAAAGLDNVVGNIIAVRYNNALNRASGLARDVVFRYFHLNSIAVNIKVGARVTKDTVLGEYGNTGVLVMGKHLHLEADTDVEHPLYSPTVKLSNLIQGRAKKPVGANDKTMSNPLEWLHCKSSAPDRQSYATAGDAYIRAEDKTIPRIS